MGTTAKALALLKEFSIDLPEIGLSDLYRRVGRDKATVHRYLTELERAGFVEQDPGTRLYRLGPAVLRLAMIRETCFPLQSAVAPAIRTTAQEVGELVHFSVLQDMALTPIAHHDPHRHGTAVVFDPGALLPLHGTASGLCLLAFGPPVLWSALEAAPRADFTDRTPTDMKTLRALAAAARKDGFALADRSFDPDVTSVALPVFGPQPQALSAVAVAAPAGRMNAALRDRAIRALRRLAPLLGQALGGHVPADLGMEDA